MLAAIISKPARWAALSATFKLAIALLIASEILFAPGCGLRQHLTTQAEGDERPLLGSPWRKPGERVRRRATTSTAREIEHNLGF